MKKPVKKKPMKSVSAETPNGVYEVRCVDCGRYEVAHHWTDGATVQIRYFGSLADAISYVRGKAA